MSESDRTCPIPSNVSWADEGFFYDHNVKQRIAAKCPFHLRWHPRRNEFPPYTPKGPVEDARDAQFATALAEAEARGRRQGLEEAAKHAHRWGSRAADEIRSLATAPADTQKPETGESVR